MSSTYTSALSSLDDSLAQAREGLSRLEAAEDVDIEEIINKFKAAAESSRKLRALVASRFPETSWENREELDALIESNPEKFAGERRRWYLPFARPVSDLSR
jgi:hypothetical protein